MPIPGTTKLHRLEENLGAADVDADADDLAEIEKAAAAITIEGERYPPHLMATPARTARGRGRRPTEPPMPHVIVKMYSGRSEEQKQKLAEAVTKAVTAITGNSEDSVSVSIEDVAPSDWTETVYTPDIENGAGKLYKLPGYGPLASNKR